MLKGLHSDNKSEANDAAISIILRLESCHTGNLDLLGLPFTLRGLHFDSDEDHVPTKIFQDLASLPLKGELRSLTMKRVPQVFVPLILANQGNISGTKNVTNSQCGKTRNFFSFYFDKNFVKVTSY